MASKRTMRRPERGTATDKPLLPASDKVLASPSVKTSASSPEKRSSAVNPSLEKHPGASNAETPWILLAIVLGITFLLFLPAVRNGFTNWDDLLYVTRNDLLKNLDANGLKAIWSTPVVSNYHPLTVMSLALNYQLAGLEPLTYHLTSICLHTVNTGLVFGFIYLLSARNKWVSTFVALLFGIHPMHVESVAWISERKDLLYTFFYILVLLSYLRYVRNNKVLYLVWATLLGLMSLLSKPAAIVLPFSMLAIDYLVNRKWSWKLVLEKLPLLVMAAVFACVTVEIQSRRAVASLEMHSIWERIAYAGYGLIWYLVKAFVPWPLSALHPFPGNLNALHILAPFLSVGLIGWIAWKVKDRGVVFGLAFYLINLLLVLQFVSIGNAVVAERYTYVPYIGLFFAVGMKGYTLLQGAWAPRRTILLGLAAAWAAALMVLTFVRIPVWHDSQSLWADVLKHYPGSKKAWMSKGLDYFAAKNWPEAISHLSHALQIDPNYEHALEWRASSYLELKQPEKALADATRLQQLYPKKEAALFYYAWSLDQTKNFDQALAAYTRLIQFYPNNWIYYSKRGVVLFNQLRQYPEARADFEKAIQLNPREASVHVNLSKCFYKMGDLPKARELARKARELGAPPDSEYEKLIGM